MNNAESIAVQIQQTASRMMHLHYCENNIAGFIDLLDDNASWIGAGEGEYAQGKKAIAGYFGRVAGAIPQCSLADEQYDVTALGGDLYVCNGHLWISTDLSAGQLVRVHHRISYVFRYTQGKILCVHMHCSNPYEEMMEGEYFPDKIGKQTYQYVVDTLGQLREEMKHKNEQISVILKAIPGGLKCSRDDETYSYVYVSEEAAGLFGYTVEEYMQATGGSAVGAVYPEDLPRVLKGLAVDFAAGVDYAQKYRVRCKDGSLKWILDRGKRTIDAQGNAVFNSLYLDVTQSEEDEQKYLQQSELLSSIYNTVPCGIVRLRQQGDKWELMSVNPAAWRLTTGLEDSISYNNWKNGMADTVIPEDRQLVLNSYNQLKNSSKHHEVDYRVRWQDGSIHILHGSNFLISQGEEGMVVQRIFVDITESKALQDAYEAARKGNAAKTEFLSQMSHDMRTPMNAIMGLTALAKESEELTEIKGYLDKMELSSKLLLNLINDVLDTEMLEANYLKLSPSPYNADDFVELLDVFMKPLCEAKNISYTLQFNSDVNAVIVDKTRLNQVMMNLLSNAVKYTPNGGEISLEVDAVGETETHATTRFVVRDNGIGMTKEYLQHLFEPFSRECRRGYEYIAGAGLGLAVTKGLVDAMGGTLEVQSELNHGSTFTMELTLEKCAKVEQESRPIDENALAGMRVLLCEDNQINAEIATHLLKAKGMGVDWAKDGVEGLAAFERAPEYHYDAILMDVRMPVMDGITATRRIRFMGRADAKTIPIIAMTANAFTQDKAETSQAGMNAHLAKPVEPALLYETLRSFLK